MDTIIIAIFGYLILTVVYRWCPEKPFITEPPLDRSTQEFKRTMFVWLTWGPYFGAIIWSIANG